METIQAKERSDRRKSAPLKTWKVLEFEDVKALSQHGKVAFLTRQGDVAYVKVTSIKTWKTRPGNIRLNLQYGLYEHSHIEFANGVKVSGEMLLAEIATEPQHTNAA